MGVQRRAAACRQADYEQTLELKVVNLQVMLKQWTAEAQQG